MATARFFERTAFAVGGALNIYRAELEALLAVPVPGLVVRDVVSANHRHIAELSINLLARLYPRVAISGAGEGADALRGLARAINPLIGFERYADPDLTIFIGDHPSRGGIAACCDGWQARLSDSRAVAGPDNPYAAGAAAAFAVGEVFRRVLVPHEARRPWRDLTLSLLDYGDSAGAGEALSPVGLGAVGFVGVGAVGNSGLWALARHEGLEGRLDLVDHELVDLSNLQRYVLTDDRSVDVSKVLLGSRSLKRTRLVARRRQMTLEMWASSELRVRAFPTLCISTDSPGSRRYAQALLPRLVVNGWTGPGTYGASSHAFDEEGPCLACLYHPLGPTKSLTERVAEALGLEHRHAAQLWIDNAPLPDADVPVVAKKLGVTEADLDHWRGASIRQLHQDVICGSALLHLRAPTEAPQFVPLAHQSALAGILMAAELVKRSSPELAARAQSQSVIRCDDVTRRTRGAWPIRQEKVTGCICGDRDYQAAFRKKWGQGRTSRD